MDIHARGLRFHVQQLGPSEGPVDRSRRSFPARNTPGIGPGDAGDHPRTEVPAAWCEPEMTGFGRPITSERSEDNPIIVFAHGLVMDNLSSFYYTLAAPLAKQGVRTVLFDLRGHGLSARPPTGYSPQDSALDLLAILDELDIQQPVYVLGNSYGGIVAMHTALKASHRVAGVVVVEAACSGTSGELWVEDIVNTLSVAALGLEFDRTQDQLKALGQRKVAKLAGNANALLNGTSLIDDLVAGSLLSEADLKQIACPVLGVFGGESELIDAATHLAAHVPDCTTHVVPGLGHTVLREATDELLTTILAWLR